MPSPSNPGPVTADILNRLAAFFSAEGSLEYLGEDVDREHLALGEHMIQAALLAQAAHAPEAMVAAALLHDIGYYSEVKASGGESDCQHELVAARFLSPYFGPAVTEPVRLHVPAKRYLCAIEPSYHDCLSEASVRSLGFQGGPMSDQECRTFEANPHHDDAVQIRRYDDAGKIPGRETPEFDYFRPLLERLRTDR